MDVFQPHLELLLRHVLVVVFVAFLVEAAGVPLPSRMILLVAATVAIDARQAAALVVVGAAGSVIGDHVPYVAGALMGPRILVLYCWITLGSTACVEKTAAYFKRFGAAAVLLSRFSASVRLFASALSGCGHITYWKFLTFDLLGSLAYIAVWTTVGYVIGQRAIDLLGRHRGARLLLLVGPAALVALIAYRLWRRRRYGEVTADAVIAESSCIETPRNLPEVGRG